LVERNGGARPPESIQPPAILADVRSGDVDHGIEERHGFCEHRSYILPALIGHLAQARIGVGVDIQRAANDVHETRIVTKRGFVEAVGRSAVGHGARAIALTNQKGAVLELAGS
jgi:hypothetical protein